MTSCVCIPTWCCPHTPPLHPIFSHSAVCVAPVAASCELVSFRSSPCLPFDSLLVPLANRSTWFHYFPFWSSSTHPSDNSLSHLNTANHIQCVEDDMAVQCSCTFKLLSEMLSIILWHQESTVHSMIFPKLCLMPWNSVMSSITCGDYDSNSQYHEYIGDIYLLCWNEWKTIHGRHMPLWFNLATAFLCTFPYWYCINP